MSDVIIVGGGIIGCAIAEALTRDGASVQLIDPRGIGGGATQASAGMLTPYKEGRHDPALETLGARSLGLYDAFVERAGGSGAPIYYSRTGSIDVAMDAVEAEELRAAAADHASRGIESTYLPGADAREVERDLAVDCVAALLIPAHGFVSAPQLAAALWRVSEGRGAAWVQDAVERIVPDGARRVAVKTARGSFTAETVVLAAGSWSGQIAVEETPLLPVKPIRGQLLRVHLSPISLTRIAWSSRCYVVPWPDGTLLVGATLEDVGFDARATVAGVRDLLEAVCELIPAAWQGAFSEARAGLRPASSDGLPLIGRSSRIPGLVYATGHYRNGVLLAPLTADLVSRILAGRGDDPALATVRPSRLGEF